MTTRDKGWPDRARREPFRRDRDSNERDRRPQPGRNPADPAWVRPVGEAPIPETAEKWRLFVALSLPEEAIEEIGTFINGMPTMAANNVRWIQRENVHLTLMFLGDTPTALIGGIEEKLTEAAGRTNPFKLELGEPGAFPSLHSPKILWVGLAGNVRQLVQLQGRIEGSLRTIGFEPEKRPFKPHITVGRAERDLTRQYAGDVGFSWRRAELPSKRTAIPVSEIQLLRSHLKAGGAVYEQIRSVPLGH